MRMFAPSPTVAASRTPLYLQGLPSLGQIDPSTVDWSGAGDISPILTDVAVPAAPGAPDIPMPSFSPQPGFLDTTPPELLPLVNQGFTPDEADLISAAAANGMINETQFQQILSGEIPKSEITNTVFGSGGITTGPVLPSGPSNVSAANALAAAAQKTANTLATAPKPGPSPRVSAQPRATAAPGVTSASMFSQKPAWAGGLSVGAVLLVGGGLLLLLARK